MIGGCGLRRTGGSGEGSGLNEHVESHLDDLLDGDDIASMPQANRLFWGQTLVALLHHLEKESKMIVIIIFCPQIILCWEVCNFSP